MGVAASFPSVVVESSGGSGSGAEPPVVTDLSGGRPLVIPPSTTVLNLGFCGLDALPPIPLGALTALSLRANCLDEFPAALSELTTLTRLDLSRNFVTDVEGVCSLVHVVELRLSNNRLKALPSALGRLSALQTLVASRNLLDSLPSSLSGLTALAVLDLSHNLLTGLPASFTALLALRRLDVRGNRLTTLPLEFSNAFPVLSSLNLSLNCLATVPPCVAMLLRLRALSLAENALTELDPDLGHLSYLEILNVEGNHLSELPRELVGLKSLKTLRCSNNDLTAVPPFLPALTRLTTVELFHNQMSPQQSAAIVQGLPAILAMLGKGTTPPTQRTGGDFPSVESIRLEPFDLPSADVEDGFLGRQYPHKGSDPSTAFQAYYTENGDFLQADLLAALRRRMEEALLPLPSARASPSPSLASSGRAKEGAGGAAGGERGAGGEGGSSPIKVSRGAGGSSSTDSLGNLTMPSPGAPDGSVTSPQGRRELRRAGSAKFGSMSPSPGGLAVGADAGGGKGGGGGGGGGGGIEAGAVGEEETESVVELKDFAKEEINDAAFNACGAEPDTVQVFRMVQFIPIPIPIEDTGVFYHRDSYIVVQTTPDGSHNIFYWNGPAASAEKKAAAVLRGLSLRRKFGKGTSESHETKGEESKEFKACFPFGIEYRQGGVKFGLRSVAKASQNGIRLMRIKGNKHLHLDSVAVSASSLNSNDVFLLDAGDIIFQWNGDDAKRKAKTKALEVTQQIKNRERCGRTRVVILEESNENEEFWNLLGGKKPYTSGAADSDDDDGDEDHEISLVKLVEVDDGEGGTTVELELIAEGEVESSLLDTHHAFILDCGSEIFVWSGRLSSPLLRSAATRVADKLRTKYERPDWTPVTKVTEGLETIIFKEKFVKWDYVEVRLSKDDIERSFAKVAKTKANSSVDSIVSSLNMSMHATLGDDIDRPPGDDGSGILECYRLEGGKFVKLDEDQHGLFYDEQAFVCLYMYLDSSDRVNVLEYFWEGARSPPKHYLEFKMGFAKALDAKIIAEYGRGPKEVRVRQGREPPHFLSLFQGRMVVRRGSSKTAADPGSLDESRVIAFHVRGHGAIDAHAIEVVATASSLNSNDSFIVQTATAQYIWYGKGSNAAERKTAKAVARKIAFGQLSQEVEEEEEPEEFWLCLGGKANYVTSAVLRDNKAPPPRLFHCSNASGIFAVEEVFPFSQQDLDSNDVAILDAYTTLFVWIGKSADKSEETMALETAKAYLSQLKDGRIGANVAMETVTEGKEPLTFVCHFHAWNK